MQMSIVMKSTRVALFTGLYLSFGVAAMAQTILVPPDPVLPPKVKTDSKAEKIGAVQKNIDLLQGYVHELGQNIKMTKAVNEARSKLPPGETKSFEVVTKGGALHEGGTFVMVREAGKDKLTGPGEFAGQAFNLTGATPGLTISKPSKSQLEAEAKLAEKMLAEKKSEELLKQAAVAEKKLAEAKAAADKAKADLDAKKKAEEDAARKAKEETEKAAKAEREARQAEREADRNGRELQNQIRGELARYRREGGPYRAPTGGGGH